MLIGKREPRSLVSRRRGEFRPSSENLEGRILLAVDLGGTSPPTLPAIATVPYGVDMAGTLPGQGSGFSVANVGDVNADTYDDFLIGAPTVTASSGVPSLGIGAGTVYLVFGSRGTNAAVITDWLTLNSQQRVGDLNQLGNSPLGQQNPINGAANFPFAGVKFVTTQTSGSQLGASVAPAGIINGTRAFLLGAPGHNDINGANPGTGRAYLIYGGSNLNSVTNNTVDLDNPANSGVTVVTYANSAPLAATGRAVGGVGDVITDGRNDIVIGAPNATVNGLAGAGAAYLVSGAGIPTVTSVRDLANVGQTTNNVPGAIFGGSSVGANFGYSVDTAGNVDGDLTSANQPLVDMIIGAPATITGGAGAAYMVYGAINLPANATTVGGTNMILSNRIGSSAADGVRGFVVNGSGATDFTGFSVSTAGDFNGDGFSDILIGSPGFLADNGRADVFYGVSFAGTPLSGSVTLGSVPSSIMNVAMLGGNVNDRVGHSVSEVGRINTTAGNPIIIGAPGFNLNSGAAYLVPSHPGLFEGSYNLGAAESQPLAATILTFTTPTSVTPAYFGASVSGRLFVTGQTRTADSDTVADYIIGAPGYAVANSGQSLAGGGLIVEGASAIPLQIPVSTTINTTIGVGQPNPPFNNVAPTTPAALPIYVFSSTAVTPNFNPFRDIDVSTTVVNGVAFPNATIAQDTVDRNNDGIPDAIITVTPRSNIGLTTNTTVLSITGRTLASSPLANRRWLGSANITVAGSNTGGGGSGSAGGSIVPIGFIAPTNFVSPFGPDRYIPQISALSRLNSYAPIPYSVAINQFVPSPGFARRTVWYNDPPNVKNQFGSKYQHDQFRTSTLGQGVFTRGKWKAGDVKEFTHKGHVVPSNLQTERLGARPRTPHNWPNPWLA